MKKFNIIASLPRSGSTLFCNILNQNPDFYASDTSPLSVGFNAYLNTIAHRPEFTSELGNSQDEATARLIGGGQGLVQGYYSHRHETYIFDKDRSNTWLYLADALKVVLPETKVFVLVRDPREVVASALRHQSELPLFRENPNPAARTLASRIQSLISPNGLVGSAIMAVTDAIIRGRLDSNKGNNTYILQFEELTSDPKRTMEAVYNALELDYFEKHDFDNVKNVASDKDFLYRNLWPHEGSGKIITRRPTWPAVMPMHMAKEIIKQFPLYCQTFGYN